MLSSVIDFYLNVMPYVAIMLIFFYSEGITIFGTILVSLLWPLAILYIAYDMMLLCMDLMVRLYNKYKKIKS